MRAFEHKQHGAELRKMCGQLLKSIVAKDDNRSSVDSIEANEQPPMFTAHGEVVVIV
jgi:hypothetical protein